jgi:hypothetical protein
MQSNGLSGGGVWLYVHRECITLIPAPTSLVHHARILTFILERRLLPIVDRHSIHRCSGIFPEIGPWLQDEHRHTKIDRMLSNG